MKKNRLLICIILLSFVLMLSACQQQSPTPNPPEPSQNEPDDENRFEATAEQIEIYDNIEITDWVDESTVIVSKENESLEKMRLSELSEQYPRSLYQYNFDTDEYTLLKEQENIFLSGAKLSSDKNHILFEGFSLGDPVIYVMDINTSETYNIPEAYSASWSDDGKVVGASYKGGAYEASPQGEVTTLAPQLQGSLFIVRKIGDKVFYNSSDDPSLRMIDLNTDQQEELNIDNVYNIIPLQDRNQLLILQDDGTNTNLLLVDNDGGNLRELAEVDDIQGISWSEDQKIVAYILTRDEDGISKKGIFLHDIERDEAIEIIPDTASHNIIFSPTGKKLVYLEQNDFNVTSTLVDLEYN